MSSTQQGGTQQTDAQQADAPQYHTNQINAGPSNAQQPNIQRPKATHPRAKQPNAQQSNAQRPNTQQRRDNSRSRGTPQRADPSQRRSTKASKFRSAMKSGRDFLSDVCSCIRIIPCCLFEGCLCLYDVWAWYVTLFCAGVMGVFNCIWLCLILGGRDWLSGQFLAWEAAKRMWRKSKDWRNRK